MTSKSVLLVLASLALLTVTTGCVSSRRLGSSDPVTIVNQYFDRWANQGDTTAADALIAPDLVLHNPPIEIRSLEAYKASMATFHAAFPDLRFTIDDRLVDRDRVLVRWTLRGTNQGAFNGRPATGRTVEITGMSLFRLDDGKIREIWVNMDRMALMSQLGWLTPTASAPTK